MTITLIAPRAQHHRPWSAMLRHRGTAGVIGVVSVFALWTLVATARPALFPLPTDVVQSLRDDWSLIWRNARATQSVALRGWLWGNGTALALAAVVAILPRLERATLRFAAIVYCLPALAIGPVLQVVLDGDNPKVALSALAVFFTTLVGALVGLRSASASALDVIHAAGGGRPTALRMVRLRASLPHLFASMRIAGPAAVLGAILGEYLGGSTGLGPAMVSAQQQLAVPRTWALGFAATALAAAAYFVAALLGRLTSPWATTTSTEVTALGERTSLRGSTGWRLLTAPVSLAATLAAAIAGWWGMIWLFDLDPLVAKSPVDVWDYVIAGPQAANHRTDLVDAMGATLQSAGVGYVAGTVTAVVMVITFVRWRTLQYIAMPAAVVMQSVPLGVFTPIFLIIFGRGITSTAFICGTVTFFPTLVMTLAAVRSVPTAILDVFDASGASATTKLRKAQLPAAIPALLAAGRVAVPRAVVGALLVEWIATGKGIGYLMLRATTMFEYTRLWAAVVVCTVTMIVLYTIVSSLESMVLNRLGNQ